MSLLEIIETPSDPPKRRLPPWLKRPPSGRYAVHQPADRVVKARNRLRECSLFQSDGVLVAKDRNLHDSGKCLYASLRFCSVPEGKTEVVQADEPERLAEGATRLGLKHVVITSVTRDNLPDGGADHFYRCVLAVRQRTGADVEVLTPDFLGNREAIRRVHQRPARKYSIATWKRSPGSIIGSAAMQNISVRWICWPTSKTCAGHDHQEWSDARPGGNARRTVRSAGRPAKGPLRHADDRPVSTAKRNSSASRTVPSPRGV